MNSNMWKTTLREIRSSLGRYLAILAITALGVGFFSGLKVTKKAMLDAGNRFVSSNDMFDYRLISTIGLTDEDVSSFISREGVEYAYGAYQADAVVYDGSREFAVRFHSLDENVNTLKLTAGRLPSSPGEIVADGRFYSDTSIGTVIRLAESNSSDTLDKFSRTDFTIVGTAFSPLYLNYERGTTSVGNGSISYFYYILPEDFDIEAYTDIYLTLDDKEYLYSDVYKELIDLHKPGMEQALGERAAIRYDSLYSDARAELDDAQAELADADIKLADAHKEIDDGRSKIADKEQELADAKAEIAEKEQELLDGGADIAEGERKLSDGEAEIAENEKKLKDAQKTISDNEKKLSEAEKELSENEIKLKKAAEEIEANEKKLADAELEINDNEAVLKAAEAELFQNEEILSAAELEINEQKLQLEQSVSFLPPEQYENSLLEITAAAAQLEAKRTELDAGKAQLLQNKAALETAKEELASGRAELNAAKEQFEEGKTAYDAGKLEYENGRNELEDAKAEVNNGRKELEKAKKELEDGRIELEDAREELEEGRRKLEDAKKEIADGEVKLSDARRELADGEAELAEKETELDDAKVKVADAEAELADFKEPSTFVLTREENIGYSCFKSDSSIVEGIAVVFPVFFFLVAALVCITTMSRMIEEQRTQIGILKALGYSEAAIMSKYMIYSGSAAVIGGVGGFFLGCYVFPKVIWTVYGMMYGFSDIEFVFDSLLFIISMTVAFLCSVGTTYISCKHDLHQMAAELIRPKSPKSGKRILLERLTFIWKRLPFLHKVSIRNVFRYKGRFIMMLLGIGGCTGLLLTGYGIRDSITEIADEQYTQILVYDELVNFTETMDPAALNDFQNEYADRIGSFMPVCQTSVDPVDTGSIRSVNLITISREEGWTDVLRLHDKDGLQLAYPGAGEVILTQNVAKINKVSIGDNITFRDADFNEWTLKVSGICENFFNAYAYISAETYALPLSTAGAPPYKSAFVNISDGTDLHEAAAAFMSNSKVGSVNVNADTLDMFSKMMQTMNYIVVLVIFCAAALAFIVLYNLTNINITERIREIATIKVLGFYSHETASYVFRENLVLTVLGALTGIPVGIWLHAYVMSNIKIEMVTFDVHINPPSFLYALLFTFAFAVFVDFVMYFKLARINMAESLKSIE
ncbi:MAG: FtsX-like permease family protein [Lachnospiraceae bacterium]|nr:FtsX-like permease family protein [Lachnospiraceae bacterium]